MLNNHMNYYFESTMFMILDKSWIDDLEKIPNESQIFRRGIYFAKNPANKFPPS